MDATARSRLNKAQEGLSLIRQAILDLLKENPSGLSNADIALELNLRSEHSGGQKNYLTYSVLGLLLADEHVVVQKQKRKSFYILSPRVSEVQPPRTREQTKDKATIRLAEQDQWFRYWMPYQFVPLDVHGHKHVYLPLNRNYKPLGMTTRGHVDYQRFADQGVIFKNDPHTFKEIWHNPEELYLYDDTLISQFDYFVRLGKLLSHSPRLLKMTREAPRT